MFFFFKPRADDYTTKQLSLGPAKDYLTTMYPAWEQFLLLENVLTNPVIFSPVQFSGSVLSDSMQPHGL